MRSPLPGLPLALAAWIALAACAPARAQAPACSWNGGVDLPGWEHRTVILAPDGAHGVLAVSSPENWFDVGSTLGTLRLQHVLEQGALDPAVPAGGAVFYTPAAGDVHRGGVVVRAIGDQAGGAYVLAMYCDPNAPKLRPWETATYRLFHVTGSGATAAGWPADGVFLPAVPTLELSDPIGLVPDAAGGAIVTWLQVAELSTRTWVRAQRFAGDGTALWPGATAGMVVMDSSLTRQVLRVAGDGAGGMGCAVSANPMGTDYDVLAGRVLASGALEWSRQGLTAFALPSSRDQPQSVAIDGGGRLFIALSATPTVSGSATTYTQLMNLNGVRSWGLFAVAIGPATANVPTRALFADDGYLTLHPATGGLAWQMQDISGTPTWGTDPGGIPADASNPNLPLPPLLMADGDIATVWADPPSEYGGPPTAVHAMEIDASGAPAPGWPATGVTLCSADYGHLLTDATNDGDNVFVALSCDYYSFDPPVVPRVLRLERPVLGVAAERPAAGLELSPPSPNPSRGEWSVSLALGSPQDVALEVFDVAGRRVLAAPLGRFPAGRHLATVAGGATLAPGIYRVRVRAGAAVAERKLVRLR